MNEALRRLRTFARARPRIGAENRSPRLCVAALCRLAAVCALTAALVLPAGRATANVRLRPALAFGGANGFTALEVARTIRGAVNRWPVPGGVDFALGVALCESGSDLQDAYAGDGYAGPFQQSTRYWPGRRGSYNAAVGPRFEVGRAGARRPRANVLVSIRMAHRSGWAGWSCA